jgi:hypothetical protein
MIAPTVQFEHQIPTIIRNEMIARRLTVTFNAKQFNGIPHYEGKNGNKRVWVGYDYDKSRYSIR